MTNKLVNNSYFDSDRRITFQVRSTHPMCNESDGTGDLQLAFLESLCLLDTGVDVVTGDGIRPRGDGVRLFRFPDDRSTEPKGKLFDCRPNVSGFKSSCGCEHNKSVSSNHRNNKHTINSMDWRCVRRLTVLWLADDAADAAAAAAI